MPYTPSLSDKISFNSTSYELTPNMKEPHSSVEAGGSLIDRDRTPSRNTELRRALDERHVNMIAFSTTVGVGCFLQSGKIISIIGPGGAILAYLIVGAVVWSANAGLGEMTAVFPVKGPIIDFCGRFIDESVGFAVGWMAWFAFCVVTATEVSVLAQTFNFSFPTQYLKEHDYPHDTLQWSFGQNTSPNVWIAFALLAILIINLLPVRIYGEVEYICGSIKICMMVLMILFNVIINSINVQTGKAPGHFWTYQKPYGVFTNEYDLTIESVTHKFFGNTARLFGIWTALSTIFFPFQAFFVVSVTAAENRKLETDETIKLATRKIALRVITLYTLLVFTVGLNVPYDDQALVDSSISSIRAGNHSPFIVACIRSGVTGLPHVLNAFFIFSAFSVAVNGLYTSSRLLHALASIRNVWPEWAYFIKIRLERTTSKGVPMAAVFTCWFFAFLSFLGGRTSPSQTLGRLAILSSTSMMVVYACVSLAFYFFKTRCTVEAEPIDPVALESESGLVLNRAASTYPYRSHLQWARSALGFVGCSMLLIFNGWQSMLSPFSPSDFVTSYISIPIFIILVVGYHIKDEATWNPLRWSRRAEMDVRNPVETTEANPLLRRGRLHRANPQKFWFKENFRVFRDFIWVWVK